MVPVSCSDPLLASAHSETEPQPRPPPPPTPTHCIPFAANKQAFRSRAPLDVLDLLARLLPPTVRPFGGFAMLTLSTLAAFESPGSTLRCMLSIASSAAVAEEYETKAKPRCECSACGLEISEAGVAGVDG